jgi:F0F1-type ATP synthase alpha subunit
VARFEAAMLKHVRDEHPEVFDELERTRDLSKELAARISGIVRDFKTHFKPASASATAAAA